MFNLLLDRINHLADSWTIWMVTATIDAALVFLIVGFIWLLVRRRVVPQVGILLFLLVPLKLLIPVPVTAPNSIAAWNPSTIVAHAFFERQGPPNLSQSNFDSNSENSSPTLALQASNTEENLEPAQHSKSDENVRVTEPTKVVTAIGTKSKIAGSDQSELFRLMPTLGAVGKLKLSAWFMLCWSTVFGFLVLRFAIREFCFRQRLRLARIIPDEDLTFDFHELCQIAGVQRAIRLIESDAVSAPAVHGILNPAIILPEDTLTQLSAEQLRWALLHELAHTRRYDLLVILGQRIASWLFFFHPAVWIANKMVHQQREYACDDEAMFLNDAPSTSAGEAFIQILRAANGTQPRATMALSVLGMGPREGCQNRLLRMLDTDRPISTRPGWISLCGVLLIAALTLPQFAAANQDGPTEDESSVSVSIKSEVKQPWRFDLQVNDMQGNPIANANIGLRRNLKDFGDLQIGEFLGKTKHKMEYKCDDQGRFAVNFDGRPNGLQLFIEHDGYEPYVANWAHRNKSNLIPHSFTAELGGAWTMGGQVVDFAGKPVEDVEIDLRIEYKKRPGDHSQLGTGDRVKTDADGKWIFRRAPDSEDSVGVEIDHPAFSPRVTELARAEFEIAPNDETKSGGRIKLSSGISISGNVSNEKGEPVADASIKVRFHNVIRKARTDSNGSYTLRGCRADEAKINVAAPGMAFEQKAIVVTSDREGLDFELKPSKGIRVRVVDEVGKPLPKSRIFFQHWRGEHAYYVFDDVNQYADENGVWEWKEAPLDEITVDVCRPGGMNLSNTKLIAREEEYVFSPPQQLFVSGAVTDAVTGEKVSSFRVIPGLQRKEGTSQWSERNALSGTDGKYRIKHYSQTYNSHFVRVEADGYKPCVSREIKSDEGEVTLDFKLEPAANMVSQVVDQDGNPVADAVVALGTKGAQIKISDGRIDNGQTYQVRRTRSDADGKFEILSGLEPFHLFVLHDSGFAHLKPKEELEAEPRSDSLPDKITLTAWSSVEGTYFVGMNPAPVSQIKVTATRMDHGYNANDFFLIARSRATTDEKGKFRFDRVFPGENRVEHDVNSSAIAATSSTRLTFPAVAGETKRVRLGGNGVTVTGQLLLPDDKSENPTWETWWIIMRENSPRPRVAQPLPIGLDGFARRLLPAPVVKKQTRSFYAHPDREGRFRIDDVPEGDWNFTASDNRQISSGSITVTIKPQDIADGDAGSAKDIGEIPTRVR